MKHGNRDTEHREIVAFLRACGASVFDAGDVGIGFPDLVVGMWGANHLIEVKTGDAPLRVSQVEFARGWRGGKVLVIRGMDDARKWIERRGKL